MEYRTMTRQSFKPTVSENLNVDHKVTLTEGVDSIFKELEGVVDNYYIQQSEVK